MSERSTWANTTHDWAMTVDREHLQLIRDRAGQYAATGVPHLVLEVLAYANDEAESLGRRGHCTVTSHGDGSISVADDGRGTDTRRDEHGRIIRKPVMATKDLCFFEGTTAVLPDGRARRGMSVVAALSSWLEHTNLRVDGGWTQRYELVSAEPLDPTLYAGFPWLTVNTANG